MNVTIEEVLSAWKVDAHIDESVVMKQLLYIPMLHSKYLGYYVQFKRSLSAAESKKNKLAFIKRKYYRGEMTLEELTKREWLQYQGLKPASGELNQLLEFDHDMIDYTHVISELKTSVSCMEYIMGQLKGREFSMKAAMDFQRFLAGS